jgi:hypothetical protein
VEYKCPQDLSVYPLVFQRLKDSDTSPSWLRCQVPGLFLTLGMNLSLSRSPLRPWAQWIILLGVSPVTCCVSDAHTPMLLLL